MQDNSFFGKPTEQSLVKARIVEKYFWAWAKVIIPRVKKGKNKIGYVDLFAGPGSYTEEDKRKSCGSNWSPCVHLSGNYLLLKQCANRLKKVQVRTFYHSASNPRVVDVQAIT